MTEGDEPGFVIDVGHEVTLYSPVCTYCKHATGFRSCEAFGDGEIPLPIWDGENDHTAPYPGDNGIRFERGTPKILRDLYPDAGNRAGP